MDKTLHMGIIQCARNGLQDLSHHSKGQTLLFIVQPLQISRQRWPGYILHDEIRGFIDDGIIEHLHDIWVSQIFDDFSLPVKASKLI
jgi:hypothetical protein